MYYIPATTAYWQTPAASVPVYSTVVNHTYTDTSKANEDLSRVKKELVELREELGDLRSAKSKCSVCSSARRPYSYTERISAYYPAPRPIQETYYSPPSPLHYCSICNDYVIDDKNPPRSYTTHEVEIQSLRHRYIPPETRPVWIPTAYNNYYPHREWVTRHVRFAEP